MPSSWPLWIWPEAAGRCHWQQTIGTRQLLTQHRGCLSVHCHAYNISARYLITRGRLGWQLRQELVSHGSVWPSGLYSEEWGGSARSRRGGSRAWMASARDSYSSHMTHYQCTCSTSTACKYKFMNVHTMCLLQQKCWLTSFWITLHSTSVFTTGGSVQISNCALPFKGYKWNMAVQREAGKHRISAPILHYYYNYKAQLNLCCWRNTFKY